MKLVKRTDEIHEGVYGYSSYAEGGASEIRCEVYSISNSFR